MRTRRLIIAALWGCLGLGLAAPAAMAQAAPQAAASSSPQKNRPKLRKRRASRQGQYQYDAANRRLRIAFPLYDRSSFDVSAPVYLLNPADQRAYTMPAWRWSTELSLALDFAQDQIWWMMRHRILETEIANPQGPLIKTTLLQGSYLRHDLNSFVSLPALDSLKIPAPFDLAVEYKLGHFELNPATAADESPSLRRFQAVQIAFLADFLRRADYRHRLAIGPVGWYGAERDAQSRWVHQVVPLSGAMLRYGWDHRDGLGKIVVSGQCGYADHLQAGQSPQWRWRCDADASAELVLFTINDQPVALPLQLNARWPLDAAQPSITATAGLRISLNLD